MIGERFVSLNDYIRRFQINNLRFHLKNLEKEEQIKPKIARRKKRAEINEIKSRETITNCFSG